MFMWAAILLLPAISHLAGVIHPYILYANIWAPHRLLWHYGEEKWLCFCEISLRKAVGLLCCGQTVTAVIRKERARHKQRSPGLNDMNARWQQYNNNSIIGTGPAMVCACLIPLFFVVVVVFYSLSQENGGPRRRQQLWQSRNHSRTHLNGRRESETAAFELGTSFFVVVVFSIPNALLFI